MTGGGAGLAVEPIGEVRTPYTDRGATPVQSSLNAEVEGDVVLLDAYRDGLADLDGFDFAWLLTWLAPAVGDPDPVALQQTPYLLGRSDRTIGLFAMRGPRRPNPIGLHLVRIVAVRADGFRFAGVDLLDRTPLLDVKPWVGFDLPPGRPLAPDAPPVRCGWFDEVALDRPHTPASLRDRPSAEGASSWALRPGTVPGSGTVHPGGPGLPG